ncbi:hypothetical protein C1S45_14385 [Lactiplantibacillus plantarum]|nr:hypothetical protein [Lactiplantibacillus plantarum]MDE4419296.1 hypothetical protein [Lactiplantibacillus plantarum]MDE4422528.1 hypothetical protein [Lactiplantibacillus plantarum]MDE4424959.1 hypothetical protein [Lactiplantibacillus plantarum]MDE4428636.1 hypothetical protein [Lactiplantibacillus plantarum]
MIYQRLDHGTTWTTFKKTFPVLAGNRVNLMVVSQKDSQLNFLMAWTPHNSWYTSIFGDMGVVPSIPNQKYG